jgi:hypothetical protein
MDKCHQGEGEQGVDSIQERAILLTPFLKTNLGGVLRLSSINGIFSHFIVLSKNSILLLHMQDCRSED